MQEALVPPRRLVDAVLLVEPADREHVAHAVLRDRRRVHARTVRQRRARLVARLHQREGERDVEAAHAQMAPRNAAGAHELSERAVQLL